MFHPDDTELILQMTGIPQEDMPAGFEQEYETRLRMLHRIGLAGSMGPLGLVILLRSFDVGPETQEREQINDWSRVRGGTEVDVAGRPARLIGVISLGTVSIRYIGQEEIHEVPNHSVELSDNAIPDIDMSSMQGSQDEDEIVVPNFMERNKAAKAKPKPVEEPSDEEDVLPSPHKIDWFDVEEGEIVFAGDPAMRGLLQKAHEDGTVTVLLGDESKDFSGNQVRLSDT